MKKDIDDEIQKSQEYWLWAQRAAGQRTIAFAYGQIVMLQAIKAGLNGGRKHGAHYGR